MRNCRQTSIDIRYLTSNVISVSSIKVLCVVDSNKIIMLCKKGAPKKETFPRIRMEEWMVGQVPVEVLVKVLVGRSPTIES